MSGPVERSAVATADFDARAATWDEDPAKLARAEAVAAAIRRDVPLDPAMRALEYGAGTGLLGFLLRSAVGTLVLADVSAGMLEVAQRKVAAANDPRLSTLQLDLASAPVPPSSYDLVFSLMTLHHIPDTAAILRRFRAVLATPGWLCIADLDREDGSFHGPEADVHRGFDREALAALALDAGFARVAFSTAHTMQKQAGGTLRTFPIFLMVARTAP